MQDRCTFLTLADREGTDVTQLVFLNMRFVIEHQRAARELTISNSISMDLADASARGVRHDKRTIKRSGSRFTVRTIASPYLGELGPQAPQSTTGELWLQSR